MDTRSTGGVLIAFAGIVLLIAGFRGTLGKVKDALLSGTPSTTGGTESQPTALTPQPTGDPASINTPGTVGAFSLPSLSAAVGIDPPLGYAGTGNQAFHPFHVAPIV